ncbi:unnamed protein product [Adineta steineri]|uniref:Transmembrane protein n=1 Tax=Adineta steineri TaxID=433720 RepID=A0A819UX22_9BILA|nr:unnamed protein product [Adineta steineri]
MIEFTPDKFYTLITQSQYMPNNTKSVSELYYKAAFFFLNLNLFPSVPPTIDEHQLRNQRISTRLFIFLLTILLSILLLYTSLINITQTVNVKAPSVIKYEQLYNSYSQTLTCDCTEISINYQKFIGIQYTLHQVCYSDFVTQNWTNYLATSSGNNILGYTDFRLTSTFTFQALTTLCALVDQTISNSLIQFYSSQYVSAFVTPSNVFQLQTDAFISQFKSATRNEFLLSLAMIRNTTQSNALLSGEPLNFELFITEAEHLDYFPRSYDNCTCASSGTCISQSPIYDLVNVDNILFLVPGLYTGCYIIESLLQSNLQCFYNQTCIDTVQLYLGSSTLINVTALDISLSNQFLENTTVADILDRLMVEEWINSSMYGNYYNECQPSRCSYTVTTKNSAIYIVTTLIGLIGGLITVLKFVVPYLVIQTLTCDCTEISINYQKFIGIQYTLHQVCHSDFITQNWTNYVDESIGDYNLPLTDFRSLSSSTFQALTTLCALVDQTISNSLIQFYSNQYVSAFVTPSNVFQLQTDAFISQFKSATRNEFLLSLAMIRNTTQSNSLFSGELTNYRLSESEVVILRIPRLYGNCTCASSGTCIVQYSIYDVANIHNILFWVPGLYTGCYIIESLLQSDLQCFYNQTCINKLQSYFQDSSFMNVTALDISLSNQFLENTTVADILDQLMVEEWKNSSIYENYYNECQPSYCSYTVTTKNSALYIITTLIGLVGGLITVLKFIVPYLVKFIMFCIKKCKRRSAPIMPTSQT